MRPSTRTSEASPARRRPFRGGALCVLLVLLFLLPARPGGAVPVVAEARVRADAGDVHGAARKAARQAVVAAVRLVVRRHVTPADRAAHSRELRRAVLDRASRYVQRYAIADERWDDLTAVVRVEAEVDREQVLSRLAGAGVPVARLAVKPRVLLLPLDPTAEGVLGALARTLEEVGYPARLGTVPSGEASPQAAREAVPQTLDEAAVADLARAAGCHLALVVAGAEDGAPSGGETPAPESLWLDPGGEPVRVEVPLQAWLVDPSARLATALLAARAEGLGANQDGAARDAAEGAGRRLGYAALERLEQSGWGPEGVVAQLRVTVTGLQDPRLVEEIEGALAAVPEVQRVRLTEVARGAATWQLSAVDAGLDRIAVLSTARLPRGSLLWQRPTLVDSAGAALSPVASLTARWQRP